MILSIIYFVIVSLDCGLPEKRDHVLLIPCTQWPETYLTLEPHIINLCFLNYPAAPWKLSKYSHSQLDSITVSSKGGFTLIVLGSHPSHKVRPTCTPCLRLTESFSLSKFQPHLKGNTLSLVWSTLCWLMQFFLKKTMIRFHSIASST